MDLLHSLDSPGCVCALGSLAELECTLYLAVKERNLTCVQSVFEDGLDPSHCFTTSVPEDAQNDTVLQFLIQEDFTEAIRHVLFHQGAQIDHCLIEVAFMYAMKHKRLHVIRMFLDAVIEDRIVMRLSHAFRHAMYTSQYDLVARIVCKPGFDVNLQATWGLDSPLHVVVHHDCVRLVTLLLEGGAMVDPVDRKGTTPLIVACSFSSAENVRILLQHGANPNHKACQDLYPHYSPLHATFRFAKDARQTERIVSMLVRSGLDLRSELWVLSKEAWEAVHSSTVAFLKESSRTGQSLRTLTFLAVRGLLRRVQGQSSILPCIDSLGLPPGLRNYLKMTDMNAT